MSQAHLQGCASRFRTDLHYSRVHARADGVYHYDGAGVRNDRSLSENDCLRQAVLRLNSALNVYVFDAHENTLLRGDESHGKRTSRSYLQLNQALRQ